MIPSLLILAEGVFDEADLRRRAQELADFVTMAAQKYQFDRQQLIAVGYSNGANIASALLLLHPGILPRAAFWRPMVPLVPNELPDLQGTPVLLAAGSNDFVIPPENARRLAALLEQAGAEVTLQCENAGHNLTPETLELTKRWLSAQK